MQTDPTVPADVLSILRQSDLATVLSCGRKFQLAKVQGLHTPSNRKMYTGTAFHRGLESLYRSLQLGERLDYAEAEGFALDSIAASLALADPQEIGLDSTVEALEAATMEGSMQVQEALAYYVQHILPEVAALGRPLAVEEQLLLEYRGRTIHGTLDLVDGAGMIRDHKLTFAYLDPDTWPTNYWAQLARYAWFWSEAVGEMPKGIEVNQVSIARLKNKDPKKRGVEHATFRDEDVETLVRVGKEMVDQALDLVDRGAFARNGLHAFGGVVCGMCPFAGPVCLGIPITPAKAESPAVALVA